MKDLYDFLIDRLRGVKKLAVLGAGSVLRADDAAGVMAVENLMADCSVDKYPNVRFYLGETAPENYSGNIRNFCPSHILIIDAADLGQNPGDIVDINPNTVGGPTFCSHMLPLKIMIDYLISETGTAVTLLGIQFKNIAFDTAMTREIREAVDEVCETLKKVIDDLF
ncbi:MAG: hydrogenase maturation protease [Eubacteriales bacterium]